VGAAWPTRSRGNDCIHFSEDAIRPLVLVKQ